MLEKSNCSECKKILKHDCISSEYLDTLSLGGLIKPSKSLAEWGCTGFALLDSAKDLLLKHANVIKNASLLTLQTFQNQNVSFVCEHHAEWGRTMANSIVTNIFFNNEQNVKNTSIRKDDVAAFKTRQSRKQ